MTNIETDMKSDAAMGLCKSVGLLGVFGCITMADVQSFFAILSYIAGGLYAAINAYVLWRDKVRRKRR